MKNKLIAAAVFAAGISQASIVTPEWIDDDGSAYAVWNQWLDYSAGDCGIADEFAVNVAGSRVNSINGNVADVCSDSAVRSFDGEGNVWLTLSETDDLSFWMPGFSGYETQEVFIQLSYWGDETDREWRAGFDLSVNPDENSAGCYLAGALVYEGDEYDDETGLVTEAWSFAFVKSSEGFYADFSVLADSLNVDVEQVSIDTISYDVIPEPATAVSMLCGGVILAFIRKKRFA